MLAEAQRQHYNYWGFCNALQIFLQSYNISVLDEFLDKMKSAITSERRRVYSFDISSKELREFMALNGHHPHQEAGEEDDWEED